MLASVGGEISLGAIDTVLARLFFFSLHPLFINSTFEKVPQSPADVVPKDLGGLQAIWEYFCH